MAGSANNILISPVDVFWRIESQSVFNLNNVSDPDGTSMKIPDSSGGTAILWFDLDAVSTPPVAGAGERLVEVAVTTGDSSTIIAAAMAAAMDADSEFSSSSVGTIVTVKGAAVGEAADPSDTDSGATIQVCYKGKNFELGLLEGEPSPNFEPQLFDVTSHQTGSTVLAKLVQGYSASVETVLQETTFSQLENLYKIFGESFAGPSSQVYGAGTGTIGKNLVTEAARLEFIPRNDQGSELSYNYTLRLAIPTPGTLLFSGENPRTLTVTWDAIPDLQATRPDLDTVIVGDINQVGVL